MSSDNSTDQVEYRELDRLPGFRFGSDGSIWKLGVGGRGSRVPAGQWRRLSPSRRKSGHSWICLDRKTTDAFRVDELVCEAFYGPKPEGAECLHRDNDRTNCRSDNLYWGNTDVMDPNVEYREWGYTPGYKYGTDGSIWSAWGSGFRGVLSGVWRRMETTRLASGHLQVQVKTIDGERRYGVHHLLCLVFYGPPPEGMECCHEDGIPDHNWVTNIGWGTAKKNAEDRIRHGVQTHGEDHGSAKLTQEQVIEIRSTWRSTECTVASLAILYGVSWQSIYKILSDLAWKGCGESVAEKFINRSRKTKLTDDQVRAVRKEYDIDRINQPTLAIKYDVSETTISRIVRRIDRKHVE